MPCTVLYVLTQKRWHGLSYSADGLGFLRPVCRKKQLSEPRIPCPQRPNIFKTFPIQHTQSSALNLSPLLLPVTNLDIATDNSMSIASALGDHPLLLATVAGGAAVIFLLIQKLSSHDPREPPLAPSSIPVIGHLIGMARRGFNYHVDIWYEHDRCVVDPSADLSSGRTNSETITGSR